MNCRRFRSDYAAFLDLAVDAESMQEMERHAATCPRCRQLDTEVRRGLMHARNLPSIVPSPSFAARLDARLVAERIAAREEARTRNRPPTVRALGVVGASLLAMAWLAHQRPTVAESWRITAADLAPVPAAEWRATPALRIRSAPLREPAVVTLSSTPVQPGWMASTPVPMSTVAYAPVMAEGQSTTR